MTKEQAKELLDGINIKNTSAWDRVTMCEINITIENNYPISDYYSNKLQEIYRKSNGG